MDDRCQGELGDRWASFPRVAAQARWRHAADSSDSISRNALLGSSTSLEFEGRRAQTTLVWAALHVHAVVVVLN